MSLVNELKALQELPPPELPPYWPQTWGWAALLAAILIAVGIALILWKRHRNANAYRRAALQELARLESLWRSSPDNLTPLRDLPWLLKQAVMAHPVKVPSRQTRVAEQSGADWQATLSAMATHPLRKDFSDQLAILAYAGDHDLRTLPLETLIVECRTWLETHRDPA